MGRKMEGGLHEYHARSVEEYAKGCACYKLHLLSYVDVEVEWHSHESQNRHDHE